jgi:predicted metal-dependent peptidase
MFGFTFTRDERIVKAKYLLQDQAPFFAYLIMNTEITSSDEIPTMCVNHLGQMKYNPQFLDSLSDKEIKGVLCHEVMHVALNHLTRLKKRDMELWNIATDMVINSMILRDGFSLPEGVLYPAAPSYTVYDLDTSEGSIKIDVDGKPAERIYEELVDEDVLRYNDFKAIEQMIFVAATFLIVFSVFLLGLIHMIIILPIIIKDNSGSE